MTRKKILILTDTMPWGHRSIAKAFFNYLKSREKVLNIKVDYAEVKAEMGVANDIYTLMYRYLPLSNKINHKLGSRAAFRDFFKEMSDINLPNLKKTVKRYQPDLIISSYFYHSHSLVRWREQEGLKFKIWTVIADPWTVNPVSFVEGADLNLVYDEKAQEEAMKFGVNKEKILITHWWVRPEMYQNQDRTAARRKLGINDNRPVIFVGGGSLGTNALPKLLPILLMIKTKVAVIFNTGTDKLAYNMVSEYVRLFRRLRKNEDTVKIINLGWIENMAEVLTAADIVFGKAGPNFLFDVMAVKKPIVAICHIGGQEDGNIELIEKKKLGWVKEKGGEAADFMLDYLKNPEMYLDKFAKNVEQESKENQKTWKIVEKRLVKELL